MNVLLKLKSWAFYIALVALFGLEFSVTRIIGLSNPPFTLMILFVLLWFVAINSYFSKVCKVKNRVFYLYIAVIYACYLGATFFGDILFAEDRGFILQALTVVVITLGFISYFKACSWLTRLLLMAEGLNEQPLKGGNKKKKKKAQSPSALNIPINKRRRTGLLFTFLLFVYAIWYIQPRINLAFFKGEALLKNG